MGYSGEAVMIPDLPAPKKPVITIDDVDMPAAQGENSDTEKEMLAAVNEKCEAMVAETNDKCIKMLEDAELKISRRQAESEEESRSLADEIIKKAQAEADEIIAKATAEAKDITDNAYEKGLEKGIAEKSEKVDTLISAIADTMTQMQQHYSKYCSDYAKELKFLSTDIVEKFLSRKLGEDELLLSDMIKQNWRAIRDAGWITVEISDKLPALVQQLQSQMKSIGMEKQVEFETSEMCRSIPAFYTLMTDLLTLHLWFSSKI